MPSSATVITTTDGLRLAVQVSGPEGAPVVVAVHGYPDDHTVWDGVVGELVATHRVATYDVRGAGASDVPGSGPATGSSGSPRTCAPSSTRSRPARRCICSPTTGAPPRPGTR
ncbi:hypothetical protein [Pseudonocardia sp. T1-2H]|uniref:hypothetical protein n=1 Tax=Pseudonocardia sp. T1-2H TaxID=3128899 RepID=UPI0031016328